MPIAHLPDRAVVEISGEDRVTFLQGLVSNDVASPGDAAVWAALLTPQGRWLADFFVFPLPDALLLDCEASQAEMLVQRLSRFRLRAKVVLREAVGLAVQAGWGGSEPGEAVAASADPRLPEAGWRAVVATGQAEPGTDAAAAAYELHRLRLGLPDGLRDLEPEKSLLLEAGFDELHGVSWTKGCYMGQELTARTRYRALLKRRLVPVEVQGPLPPRGAPIVRDGAEVGDMRSGRGASGLAMLRLDALAAGPLSCGGATLLPRVPDWMRLPAADALSR